jgi:hypothetical protein
MCRKVFYVSPCAYLQQFTEYRYPTGGKLVLCVTLDGVRSHLIHFVEDFSSSGQLKGLYIKLGNGCFLTHPFPFFICNHGTIPRYTKAIEFLSYYHQTDRFRVVAMLLFYKVQNYYVMNCIFFESLLRHKY